MKVILENIIKARRSKITKLLDDNSLLILYSGKEITKSEDISYPFSVNRNYFYLANLSIQRSFFILVKNNKTLTEYISINEVDKRTKNFYGEGLSRAKISKFGFVQKENILKNCTLSNFLEALIKENTIKTIYVDFKNNKEVNEIIQKINAKPKIKDIYNDIISLREEKDQYEINCLKKAANVTKKGFNKIFNILKNATKEYEILNGFNEEILNNGTHELAFDSIIASGKNATCLHYAEALGNLVKDELVLCDVGASYNHYACDVTRTIPISGKYNQLQKIIYSIVEKCNRYIISLIKPGITLHYLQEETKKFLSKNCLKHNLIKYKNDLEKVYYHNVSHHVGLDVHDPNLGKPLKANNVITVEPGLYFKKLKIGIRIEDTVLVTDSGAKVITNRIPKKIGDIENILQ